MTGVSGSAPAVAITVVPDPARESVGGLGSSVRGASGPSFASAPSLGKTGASDWAGINAVDAGTVVPGRWTTHGSSSVAVWQSASVLPAPRGEMREAEGVDFRSILIGMR